MQLLTQERTRGSQAADPCSGKQENVAEKCRPTQKIILLIDEAAGEDRSEAAEETNCFIMKDDERKQLCRSNVSCSS